MSFIEINETTCNQCGICAAECPDHLIAFVKGSFPRSVPFADAVCIRCGHCVAVCPSGSLSHQEESLEKSPEIQKGLQVTPEQCEQLLKSRRSVRVFKDQPVPREIISRLIEVARYAPTGHNNQEVEWLVIDNKKELEHIEELAIDWLEWTMQNQPQMAAAFHMDQLLKNQKKHHNVFLRGAPVLVVVHAKKGSTSPTVAQVDCATALGYLDLAANSLGLGTCWGGFVNTMANTFPPVKEAIALPETQGTYGCMMLGYNKYRYQRIPPRKDPQVIWR
jgi:nitroreductase/NAD-dependent dihydropyrimidine dehydrogenase PreA subunit